MKGGAWEILGSHVPEHTVGTKPLKQDHDIRARWWNWCKSYMNRSLTCSSDHYAAFAGVTDLYREMTGDEPILGLWRRYLQFHLGWGVYPTDDWQPLQETRQPSWTWMTFPHGSVRPWLYDIEWKAIAATYSDPIASAHPGSDTPASSPLRYQAEIIDIDVRWTGAPLVSSPASGTLKIHGLLHRLTLPRDRFGGSLTLDPDVQGRIERGSESAVFALFSFWKEGELIPDPPAVHTVYLVIESTGAGELEYRRVGRMVGWVRLPPGTEMQDAFPGTYRTITLV